MCYISTFYIALLLWRWDLVQNVAEDVLMLFMMLINFIGVAFYVQLLKGIRDFQ